MTVCPQCGYERKTNDDNFVNAEECPKCGIFYKKWKPSSISNNTEPILKSSEASNINKEKKSIQYKSIITFAIIFILLAIFAKFFFFSRNEQPRLISTLSVIPPPGMALFCHIIRASGNEETITAAGQIFKPPLQTPVLFKLGFLFTQRNFTKKVPNFKLQIIISEWYGDHPNTTALWVSEPTAIPDTNNNFQADWLDFEVHHLPLNPAKFYVAWITLSGLANQDDANVGISAMWPRDSKKLDYVDSPYPEGMCTFYKQSNPYGYISQMTNSPWEVHDVGRNLHFRMSFENSKKEHDKKDLENDGSQSRLNELIQQKTNNAIIQWREREDQKAQQRQGEIKQQQVEREMQYQAEIEQRQEEMKRQQIEREQQQEERKRQQIEREIQQYEKEQQQNESNASRNMPRPVYKIPKLR